MFGVTGKRDAVVVNQGFVDWTGNQCTGAAFNAGIQRVVKAGEDVVRVCSVRNTGFAVLSGHPVEARHGSFRYASGRFLRRNWIAVSTVGAFLAMVSGFGLQQMQQAKRLSVALVESDQQRRTAQRM